MTMGINGSSYSKTNYVGQRKETQAVDVTEKAKGAEKVQDAVKAQEKTSVLHDEYISSEKSGAKPNGLYRVEQDENGNKKVTFEDPRKPDRAEEKEGVPTAKAGNPGKPAEKCTGNNDKVEREIRKLKEQKKQLEKQIRSASGDEKKIKELENKLAQIESELSQKDNDAYRRQNTVFSE